MSLLSRLAAPFRKAATTDREGWFFDWATGGGKTAAGVSVSPDTALRVSTVWACVNVRAEDIGKVPVHLYRRLPGGGKERATDHPLYRLIHDQPNPRMTAFEFRQVMQASRDLRGNALAVKEFDARGDVVALWPLGWQYVEVLQTPDYKELYYRLRIPNRLEVTLASEEVIHLRGLTLDGVVGLSPITYHRETIGLAVAADRYAAQFFGNNAQPMGALKVPGVLSPEAAAKLRASWKERHEGKRELGIFDGGMEWIQTGMDNADAQYIEQRKFTNSDIARLFRMPPHKIGDLDKATFSNIEQQSLEYVTDCLLSEIVRWEQTLRRDLLTEEEKSKYFFEFLVDVLLRGDLKSRYEAYAIGRNWGWMSADDIRDRENMNPLPEGKGKVYLQPLNMIEAGTQPEPTAAGLRSLRAQIDTMIARQEHVDA
jgi:HK97 family phage portal protein